MRYIFIAACLFPLCLAAQDCKIKKFTDPYTKEAKVSTGFIQLQGASLSIEADSKEVDLFFSIDAKEKCFNDASTAVVTFDSVKQKGTFKNNGTVNCDGFFHIIFKNGPSVPFNIQKLLTKKINIILITGTNKTETRLILSPEEQQEIITRADCLIKEAKKLVK
jgi:hypothetical protein